MIRHLLFSTLIASPAIVSIAVFCDQVDRGTVSVLWVFLLIPLLTLLIVASIEFAAKWRTDSGPDSQNSNYFL